MALRDLTLPRLGETMDSGQLVKWLKRPGDWCERGETILELETDKTVVELPSLLTGRLVEILRQEGEQVEVGSVIARIDAEGSGSAAAPAPSAAIEEVGLVDVPGLCLDSEVAAPTPPPVVAAAAPQRATPVARRLAAIRSIALDTVKGTGRRGRIETSDVLRAVGDAAGAASVFHPPSEGCGGLAWRSWAAQGPARGTLVLLHGFAGDSQTWAVMGSHLSRTGHAVLAPDFPSHGDSSAEADSLDALLGSLQRWLAEVCSGPYELVGHSMGAVGAVRLASLVAKELRPPRVTLFAPIGLGLEIDAGFVLGMACVDNVETFRHLLRKLALRPPSLSRREEVDMVATLGPRGRLHGLAAALVHGGYQRVDIVPEIAALGGRARVVFGLEDRIVPWQHVLNLSAATAVHLVRQAGHMLHWDDPAAAAALFD